MAWSPPGASETRDIAAMALANSSLRMEPPQEHASNPFPAKDLLWKITQHRAEHFRIAQEHESDRWIASIDAAPIHKKWNVLQMKRQQGDLEPAVLIWVRGHWLLQGAA